MVFAVVPAGKNGDSTMASQPVEQTPDEKADEAALESHRQEVFGIRIARDAVDVKLHKMGRVGMKVSS